MSSKSRKASKPAAKKEAARPTNEALFTEYLQAGMKKYGCAISASPVVGFTPDGCLRLLRTDFSIVPVPKEAAKPPVPAPGTVAPAK